MAIIPSFFMNAVVSLGVKRPEQEPLWIGTGFLAGRKERDDPSQSTVYIITNKHVVRDQKLLYVRFNNADRSGVTDLPMPLEDNGVRLYTGHPFENTDVVAIKILPQIILEHHLQLNFIDPDDHGFTLREMQNSGIEEGSLIYALGFPMNLVGDAIKAPICRLGCISRIADAFIAPDLAEKFIVDAPVFPGNSGGPIICRPEMMSIQGTPHNSTAGLIGILSAYIPYRDELISQQTKKTLMIREENSGLTVVHPVDRIKEVIELEWERGIRS